MSNMSYCRNSNTLSDLLDCYENMDVSPEDERERKAMSQLILLCITIAEEYGDKIDDD